MPDEITIYMDEEDSDADWLYTDKVRREELALHDELAKKHAARKKTEEPDAD